MFNMKFLGLATWKKQTFFLQEEIWSNFNFQMYWKIIILLKMLVSYHIIWFSSHASLKPDLDCHPQGPNRLANWLTSQNAVFPVKIKLHVAEMWHNADEALFIGDCNSCNTISYCNWLVSFENSNHCSLSSSESDVALTLCYPSLPCRNINPFWQMRNY